jgi:hypothetical protein
MNNDLISRAALKKEFCNDIMGGLNWERIIDSAPAVEPFEKIGAICNENCGGHSLDNTFTRDELEAWLYANAANNLDGNKRDQLFADDCEEIIKRLDGFERFVKDRREGKI